MTHVNLDTLNALIDNVVLYTLQDSTYIFS